MHEYITQTTSLKVRNKTPGTQTYPSQQVSTRIERDNEQQPPTFQEDRKWILVDRMAQCVLDHDGKRRPFQCQYGGCAFLDLRNGIVLQMAFWQTGDQGAWWSLHTVQQPCWECKEQQGYPTMQTSGGSWPSASPLLDQALDLCIWPQQIGSHWLDKCQIFWWSTTCQDWTCSNIAWASKPASER